MSEVQFTSSVVENATYIKLNPLSASQVAKGIYRELQSGQAIEGILKTVKSVTGKYGLKQQYVVEEFGTGAALVLEQIGNLKARIDGAGVKPGDAIQINYLGKTELKSGPFKGTLSHTFRVETEAT